MIPVRSMGILLPVRPWAGSRQIEDLDDLHGRTFPREDVFISSACPAYDSYALSRRFLFVLLHVLINLQSEDFRKLSITGNNEHGGAGRVRYNGTDSCMTV
jgi:hypothetical protein